MQNGVIEPMCKLLDVKDAKVILTTIWLPSIFKYSVIVDRLIYMYVKVLLEWNWVKHFK